MTFDQAQTAFQQIVRRINTESTPADLLQAQRDLDSLEDRLRGQVGFDSVRSAIDSVYDKLVGQITVATLRDIQSRDAVFQSAAAALDAIQQKGNQNAGILSLEKTRVVLPALDRSAQEIKGVIEAIKNGNPAEALTKGEALWALVERVKAQLSDS